MTKENYGMEVVRIYLYISDRQRLSELDREKFMIEVLSLGSSPPLLV